MGIRGLSLTRPSFASGVGGLPQKGCLVEVGHHWELQRRYRWLVLQYFGASFLVPFNTNLIYWSKKKKKDGWCSNDTRDTYGVELWKAIRRGWDDFKSRTFFVVDNVWTMKFLKDVCCGDPALSASFPLLLQKDAWVGLQICRRR